MCGSSRASATRIFDESILDESIFDESVPSDARTTRERKGFVHARAPMARPRPTPPRPDLVRRPTGPFGWLDARLVRDRWLSRAGADATAVLVFLALVADGQGSSFYGRDRMALALGLSREALDRALARLLALELVAHRPWRAGTPDGVWQVLPLTPPVDEPRGGEAQSIASILTRLGLRS